MENTAMHNRPLVIEDFERKCADPNSTFPHYYSLKFCNDLEICLEACLSGYCVALYHSGDPLSSAPGTPEIVGEKECTNLPMMSERLGGILSTEFPSGEMQEKAITRALAMANEIYGKLRS